MLDPFLCELQSWHMPWTCEILSILLNPQMYHTLFLQLFPINGYAYDIDCVIGNNYDDYDDGGMMWCYKNL